MTLQEIVDIGRSLRTALEFAKGSPGTLGMENAWHRADQASQELGRLLGDDRAFPLLQAVEKQMLKARRGG